MSHYNPSDWESGIPDPSHEMLSYWKILKHHELRKDFFEK